MEDNDVMELVEGTLAQNSYYTTSNSSFLKEILQYCS